MMTQTLIIAGILGACLGSFLNVVAHRSIQGRSWRGNERSACESCGHVLGVIELVPVISWLIQRGRCRHCGAKISARYIIVEVICAALAVTIIYRWRLTWAALIAGIGTCGLVLNSLTDYESGDVFDVFAVAPGIVCLLLRIAGGFPAVLDGLAGAVSGWAVFAVIIVLSRGGMGWGDAVFMAGIGAAMGLKFTLFAFYAGIMSGGFWVILMMIIGRLHWGRGESIPLVPFLSIGCFLTMIFGPEIFAYLGGRMLSPEIFSVSWPFAAVN
ncbi:MAG: prepilin peptidase [Synergistaceae bacterium]|nr:prepilin peptidase [Synergistaceae bacterium]